MQKKYLFCITCGIWSEKTSKSGKVFSAGLSKMRSTFPVDSLWANQVSKKYFIIFHFRNLNDLFFLAKKLGHCCQNCILCVRKKLPMKWFFLVISCFFYHLRTRSQKISAVRWNIFNKVVKTAFNLSRGKFWGKKLYLCSSLFHFFPIFVRSLKQFGEKIEALLSKCSFKCPEKHFQKELPVRKTHKFFLSISGFELIFLAFSRKFFSRLSKLQSMCPSQIFKETGFVLKNRFLTPLLEFRRKILDFLRKNSGSFVKIVFAESRGKIWRKTIFHHVQISDDFFWLSTGKFRQCRENCSLRVRRKLLRDFFFRF